jgi:hypothetical protein
MESSPVGGDGELRFQHIGPSSVAGGEAPCVLSRFWRGQPVIVREVEGNSHFSVQWPYWTSRDDGDI